MLKDFKMLKLTLASPEKILSWSSGEVKKAETINYRTQRAEVDGLMCEKIFGPTVNYQCYCGKYKKVRYKGIVCDKCGVEVTHSRVRRERMGHIKLVTPIVHIWFSHGVPNKLSTILDIPKKKIESVIYFARYIVVDVNDEERKNAIERILAKEKDEVEALKRDMEKELKLKEVEEKELKKEIKVKRTLEKDALLRKKSKEIASIKEVFTRKIRKVQEKFKELRELAEKIVIGEVITEEQNSDLQSFGVKFYEVQMGAEGIKTLLTKFKIQDEIKKLYNEKKVSKSKGKVKKIKSRLRLLEGLFRNGIDPKWIVMDVIPVIPPALRPIIQLSGGRFATADLNDLYRRVINRNNRLKRLIELGAPEIILRNEKRMLQEAVDALIDNSHRESKPVLNSRGQAYKSLSDILRGKEGRFRQNLLGKRVDYSGRAVIAVGPELSLYECGIPKVVALELFRPFVMREVIAKGLSPNIKSAKNYIDEQPEEVWDILEQVIKERPVLLNRAPTLHKQGIQAFFPVLIEGNAIRINPMVCKGFNADFDGDQMAVHVPITKKAVDEALGKMMADSNMLLMANGNPIVNVNKDMTLGLYLLTKIDQNSDEKKIKNFSSKEEAITSYYDERVKINEEIRVLINDKLEKTTIGRLQLNEVLPKGFEYINKTLDSNEINSIVSRIFKYYGKKETIKVLDKFKQLGFWAATEIGFSVSIDDLVTSEKRDELLKKTDDEIEKINESYYNGLITNEERKSLSEEIWMKATEEIADVTWKEYEKRSIVFEFEKSGAYPVKNPARQISAIRGLILDPMGKIVELPLRSNYLNGLTSLEYFVAARGTRKGLTDTALKTSGSGYLTRKLVDVAHDIVTKIDDCKTKEGITLSEDENRRLSFEKRITGRISIKAIKDPKSDKIIIDADKEIDEDTAKKIVNAGIKSVEVRSPLTCIAEEGICCRCYGYNLGTQKLVEKGTAVGVIAAQSMGEASTQLTLETKHLAGRVGTDITQGLPRVEELFEARVPKGKAILAQTDGVIKFKKNEDGEIIEVIIEDNEEFSREIKLKEGDVILLKKSKKVKKGDELLKTVGGKIIKSPYDAKAIINKTSIVLQGKREVISSYPITNEELLVHEGERVNKGQQLTVGSADLSELLHLKGLIETQKYVIDNVQETYGMQGIAIDDKHVEVVARKMASFVVIDDCGDSEYLPGDIANYYEVSAKNRRLKEAGKIPATFTRKLLGITVASINTESFLSAASFQEVVRVLSDACLVGKVDKLRGLKENVIIGRPVPLGEYLR